MTNTLPIKLLKVDRPIRLGPALLQSALQDSIKAEGILRPLVIDETYRVIDGVRRMEAASQVGLTEVPVFMTDDFDVAISEIQKTTEHGLHALTPDHYRVWYLYQDTKPIVHERWRQQLLKANRAKGKKRIRLKPPSREMISRALGVADFYGTSSMYLLARVFDSNHLDHAAATRYLELVDDGLRSISSAQQYITKARRVAANPPLVSQRTVISNAATMMTNVARALGPIVVIDSGFSTEELDSLISDFANSWGAVKETLRILREERRNRP